ncbi:hypothetical protein [Deinococcus humi]|uniref:Uncharacterized protein n=1 Tax=Deinococcus humi TaxID=662880 RepID=A0A7W8ND66_9DEIO|nr:hypothetical protein [Deinococcus humi]MBB5361305.1 hypothetical protein [Deinococcus humi]GGO19411.1 hypothetical protein GCM10008949_03710 [Deinococcus humi]
MSEQVLVSREYLNNLLSCFEEGGDYGAHFVLPEGVDSLELAEWCNTLYADLEAPALTPPAPAEADELRAKLEGVAQELERDSNRMQDHYALGLSAAAGKIRAALKSEATP